MAKPVPELLLARGKAGSLKLQKWEKLAGEMDTLHAIRRGE
jgi:hypothetical protein